MSNKQAIKKLTCSCCGKTTLGKQWRGYDTGYVLCLRCADWIAEREGEDAMYESYDERGYHYDINN